MMEGIAKMPTRERDASELGMEMDENEDMQDIVQGMCRKRNMGVFNTIRRKGMRHKLR
ncbi:hypothetical protein BR93DRAFT_923642 [Coniochaeta sp. PMI_546]|nr:hypothetical protein BR93DRAFT_923642 [Coniochaeta sp. PMI_546]